MKRTRLSRKENSRKENRLDPMKEVFLPTEKGIPNKLSDLYDGYGDTREPEEVTLDNNLKKAEAFVAEHPDEHVSLKLQLSEEPVFGAGKVVIASAGDFLRFNDFEAVDSKTGQVFRIKRENVKDVIGIELDSLTSLPSTATSKGTIRRYAFPKDMLYKNNLNQETESV